jgi:hypothetical protein
MNVLFRHLDGDAPSLVDTREGFSPELSRIVAKAMQRDKDERYATAMEVFADLDRVEL